MLQSFVWIKSSGHLSGVVRESLVRVLVIDPTSQSLVHSDHSPQSEYLQSETGSTKLKKVTKDFTFFLNNDKQVVIPYEIETLSKKVICTKKIQHYMVENSFEVCLWKYIIECLDLFSRSFLLDLKNYSFIIVNSINHYNTLTLSNLAANCSVFFTWTGSITHELLRIYGHDEMRSASILKLVI